jgi:hypothetical protein
MRRCRRQTRRSVVRAVGQALEVAHAAGAGAPRHQARQHRAGRRQRGSHCARWAASRRQTYCPTAQIRCSSPGCARPARADPAEYELRLSGQVTRRRTHRAGFRPAAAPAPTAAGAASGRATGRRAATHAVRRRQLHPARRDGPGRGAHAAAGQLAGSGNSPPGCPPPTAVGPTACRQSRTRLGRPLRARRPLPVGASLALFRGAQEALTNIARYAPGATAAITVRYQPDRTLLGVQDHGICLGAGNSPAASPPPPVLCLSSARCAAFGTITSSTAPGRHRTRRGERRTA